MRFTNEFKSYLEKYKERDLQTKRILFLIPQTGHEQLVFSLK